MEPIAPSFSWHIFLRIRSWIVQSLLSAGEKQLAYWFNFMYMYIDDVLSINDPEFENYLGKMYSVEHWDKRHDRKEHFCTLPRCTLVDRQGLSPSFFQPWKINVTLLIFQFLSDNIHTVQPNRSLYMIHHISYRQREGLLRIKFVIYGTLFQHIFNYLKISSIIWRYILYIQIFEYIFNSYEYIFK